MEKRGRDSSKRGRIAVENEALQWRGRDSSSWGGIAVKREVSQLGRCRSRKWYHSRDEKSADMIWRSRKTRNVKPLQ